MLLVRTPTLRAHLHDDRDVSELRTLMLTACYWTTPRSVRSALWRRTRCATQLRTHHSPRACCVLVGSVWLLFGANSRACRGDCWMVARQWLVSCPQPLHRARLIWSSMGSSQRVGSSCPIRARQYVRR